MPFAAPTRLPSVQSSERFLTLASCRRSSRLRSNLRRRIRHALDGEELNVVLSDNSSESGWSESRNGTMDVGGTVGAASGLGGLTVATLFYL